MFVCFVLWPGWDWSGFSIATLKSPESPVGCCTERNYLTLKPKPETIGYLVLGHGQLDDVPIPYGRNSALVSSYFWWLKPKSELLQNCSFSFLLLPFLSSVNCSLHLGLELRFLLAGREGLHSAGPLLCPCLHSLTVCNVPFPKISYEFALNFNPSKPYCQDEHTSLLIMPLNGGRCLKCCVYFTTGGNQMQHQDMGQI